MLTSTDLERHDDHHDLSNAPRVPERLARLACLAAAWTLGGITLVAAAHLLRTLIRFVGLH